MSYKQKVRVMNTNELRIMRKFYIAWKNEMIADRSCLTRYGSRGAKSHEVYCRFYTLMLNKYGYAALVNWR